MISHDTLARSYAKLHHQHSGEWVVYRPKDKPPRRVLAIIKRDYLDPITGMSNGRAPRFEVAIEWHATRGVAVGELDTGGDRFDLALHFGGQPEERHVQRIISEDATGVVLEAR